MPAAPFGAVRGVIEVARTTVSAVTTGSETIKNHASFIWSVADLLRGDYKPRSAIVFNGSPLFTGSAQSGESEIRRWIIEND